MAESSCVNIIKVAISLLQANQTDLALNHLMGALDNIKCVSSDSEGKGKGKGKNTGEQKKQKRVPSAYNLWLSENMKNMSEVPYKQRMGILSGQWKTIDSETKTKFDNMRAQMLEDSEDTQTSSEVKITKSSKPKADKADKAPKAKTTKATKTTKASTSKKQTKAESEPENEEDNQATLMAAMPSDSDDE